MYVPFSTSPAAASSPWTRGEPSVHPKAAAAPVWKKRRRSAVRFVAVFMKPAPFVVVEIQSSRP
jgi:hypothetical protein